MNTLPANVRHSRRAYYSDSIENFLSQSNEEIFGRIASADSFTQTLDTQRSTWNKEIATLKKQLVGITEGRILFEYIIPRMGKRVDVVILHRNIVFLLEFKCGDTEYKRSTYNQVYDYALDLRNFHKESHNKLLVCLMVSDCAPAQPCTITKPDNIIEPIACNAENIRHAIDSVCVQACESEFDYRGWENSPYMPTPTIIEAAQALYNGHNVEEITRCDAGAENLTQTTSTINQIIEHSKRNNRKSICFVTGVPGAGKTLVGLNIAIQHSDKESATNAIFLSGNQPLVTVLQEALVRDKVAKEQAKGIRITKETAKRQTRAFIQIIHKYRDEYVNDLSTSPPEHIAIFDEAQRAWTHEAIKDFMARKKGITDFPYSEPEFLISTMNRHTDWAVVICLVGGGQEINTGEAGLPEWFDSLRRSFTTWDVYLTPQLKDEEYRRGRTWQSLISDLNVSEQHTLHLNTSIRSFRTPDLATFTKSLLDIDIIAATNIYEKIKEKYPIVITRNLASAKQWIKQRSHGTTRYGLLASSGAKRLKPVGIYVKGGHERTSDDIAHWMLNDMDDVRSSYALEEVATEFDIQGLELDFSIVAWDADLRFRQGEWTYHRFSGNKWQTIHNEEKQLYLKNAYRVLLTRARQGMAIFIPSGSTEDTTRKPEFYDELYSYLQTIGITELD